MAKKLLEAVFLGPGNAVCNAVGVGQENNRDLLRMLVNSLVWTAVGTVAVVLLV